mmetsp:Transcript_135432/g.342652  ORF Transcript_135432/g.342652 Transcript_135432/m.342652 type:complete len:309 (-) Transcript_135432:160-1086(-)
MCYGFLQVPRGVPQHRRAVAESLADAGAKGDEDLHATTAAVEVEQVHVPRVAEDIEGDVIHKTVIFVRHGQAVHNIVEERVKEQASRAAEACGYAKDSTQFQALVKEARLEALRDEALRDAALSELGKAQVLDAKHRLEHMIDGPRPLPQPTAVLVSPLFRTLQTASILFPEHPKIQVSRVLCERNTGLPCDRCSDQNRGAHSFPHIDFDQDLSPQSCNLCSSECEENAFDVRCRSASLAKLLQRTEDQTIAVVSHKGFLRELERGPLHHACAKEFKPAELRVFDVTLFPDGSMDASDLVDSTWHTSQ